VFEQIYVLGEFLFSISMIPKALPNAKPSLDPGNRTAKQADQLLWDNFRRGCENAYCLIYKEHFFSLYNYGLKICPEKEIVKDYIQDLFVYLWRNREKLGPTDSIRFYLFTALKRRLIDNFSAQSKFDPIEEVNEVKNLGLVVSEEYKMIDDQLLAEKSHQVRLALETLTLRQKEAVVLKFYENMPNEEIAFKMDISVEGVYNLISKALRRFRKDFSKVSF
jgi:RNA polymerase sigma factor (sigma-70 family)